MEDRTRQIVAEILRLGEERRSAYLRLDELETELLAGGTIVAFLRAVFPGSRNRAKRQEYDNTVRTIELLRRQMDELKASIPLPQFGEAHEKIAHLWQYENSTSLSKQRAARRTG